MTCQQTSQISHSASYFSSCEKNTTRHDLESKYIYIYGSSTVFATIVVSHQTSASHCLDEIIWNLNFWIIPLWQVWWFSVPLHTPVEEIMFQSAAWNYAMQTGRTKKGWKHLFRRFCIQKCKSTTWSWKSNSCTVVNIPCITVTDSTNKKEVSEAITSQAHNRYSPTLRHTILWVLHSRVQTQYDKTHINL